jgi:hypothetical protein
MTLFDVKVRLFSTKHIIVSAQNEADMEMLAIEEMKRIPKGVLIAEWDILEYESLTDNEAWKRINSGRARASTGHIQ